MGAWGYGSFENDTALDFVPDLFNEKAIKKLVCKKNISEWDYDAIRVSAEVLLHLHKLNNLWVEQETIDGLIKGLEVIIADKAWFDNWNDERDANGIKRQLKGFIRKLGELEGY